MTFGFGMGFPRASSASGGSSLDLQFAGATTLDPLITFIRPSTGTYFDDAGVLQSAAVNLLTYSQDFSNVAWTKANVTASSGSTAPNGTATGFTVTGAAGTSIKRIRQSVTSTQTTWAYSVFLKAGTYSAGIRAKPRWHCVCKSIGYFCYGNNCNSGFCWRSK